MAFLNNANEPDLDLLPADAQQQLQRRAAQAAKLLEELPDKWPVKEENLQWSVLKLGITNVTTTGPADSPDTWKILDDGSILFVAPGPDRNITIVSFDTPLTNITSLRLEALTDDSLPSKGPGRTEHGNFVLTEIKVTRSLTNGSSSPEQVRISSAAADAEQDGFPIQSAFDGKDGTGWAVHAKAKPLNQPRTAIFNFAKPIQSETGSHITIRLEQTYGSKHTMGRMRLSLGMPAVPDSRPLLVRRQEAMEKAFAQWLSKERKRTVDWHSLRPAEAKSNLPLLTVQSDDSVFASGDISKSDTYDLVFTNHLKGITAVRLEALPDDRLPAHGPGMTYYEGPKGDFFLGEFQVKANGQAIKFSKGSESYAKNTYGSSASAKAATDGDPQTGWSCAGRMGEAHAAVFVADHPFDAEHLDLRMLFGRHYACSLGRFRISVTTAPGGAEARDLPEEIERLLLIPDSELTSSQRHQLREAFLLAAPELAEHARKIRDLRKPPAYPTTLVLNERPAENSRATFVHNRGEFLQPKDRVEPGVPAFLPSLPQTLPGVV